jgi:4-amino-4-deoxy-L-arabinose transferase-like glycosyltransferase
MPANKKRRWRLTDWLLPVILVGLGVGSWIAASNSRGFFGEATTTSLGYTVIGWALISAGVSWLIARRT